MAEPAKYSCESCLTLKPNFGDNKYKGGYRQMTKHLEVR